LVRYAFLNNCMDETVGNGGHEGLI
jgi:hypothetical protein